jgi:hypothetical protein
VWHCRPCQSIGNADQEVVFKADLRLLDSEPVLILEHVQDDGFELPPALHVKVIGFRWAAPRDAFKHFKG